jgi:hypothetical protein
MPPTFFLVAGLMLLALIGPLLAAGLLIASLVPATRDAARPVLRWGLIGAVAGLAVGALLSLAADYSTSRTMLEGMIIGGCTGFTIAVIARAIRSFARFAATEPEAR